MPRLRNCFWPALLVSGLLLTFPASGELLPFPLSATQRGTVTCLENPAISYDIFLPPAYSPNGPPLPIIYTFNSSGGGLVSYFRTVCSNLNIIAVGIVGPRNSNGGAPLYREAFAATRDIRRRVLFDPTAEFAGGISGGGVVAYYYSRVRSQHVAGLVEMAGWLGVSNIDTYRSTDRVQTNLLVARTTGNSDNAALYYLPLDSNYLASVGAVIKDWYFDGGHVIPPDSVKTECFNWLLEQRAKPGPDDQSNSMALASSWRARIAAGQQETVLRECVAVLMERPRSWDAFQAQLILDDLEGDYAGFRSLGIDNLGQGDFASDMFLHTAHGAADAGDLIRYRTCMRAITGITESSGHHYQTIHDLLVNYGYPAPILEYSIDSEHGWMTLLVHKDAPGLTYSLQSRSNFTSDAWRTVSLTAVDTNTIWSTVLEYQNGLDTEFYRLSTVIPFQPDQNPTISSQPKSRTNYAGTTATFSVTASGNGPFAYQWRKNGLSLSDGGNVSGATSSNLTLSTVSQSDAASYEVVVTGFSSVTTDPPATLTVISFETNQVPTISSQPQSRTNYAGTAATFSVTASGHGPFAYQWRKNRLSLSDGGNVSGATSSNLTLSTVSQSDAASYEVIVIGFSSVTSAPVATLTIIYPTVQLILHEPFDYPNIGGPVNGNTPANWTTGGSGANDLNVATGNLSYHGLAASTGNSVTNGGAGLAIRRLFGAGVNSGKLYFSALFKINNLGYPSWNGSPTQVGAFTATDNTSFRLQVMVETTSSGYVIGVKKGGTGATDSFDTTEYYAGDTIFLVGKYDFTVSPNRVSLWINPDPSTFGFVSEPTAGFISATSGPDGFAIDRFNMRQNTTATVPAAIQWDELRIGAAWADVTPLP